jgi:type I restriction enzyme S subunit
VRFVKKTDSQNPDNFIAEGDLLFTRLSGSIEFVANCAIVPSLRGKRIQYPDRLFCARLKNVQMNEYIELCFANAALREELTARAKSSAGHQRVSISDITGQRMPLPPLAEQEQIVRRVEALFKITDRIEARYQEAKKRVDALTQSILAKAFRGELLPTEAALARREK